VARKSSSTALQEELYPLPRGTSDYDASERGAPERDASERELFDDARLVDLEAEQESPFLRGQKRVSARRGSLPKKTANLLKWIALALVVLGMLSAFGAALYRYGKHSWRFRIDSSEQIEVSGSQHVSHAQIMEVLGGDIGRNIFFIPLSQRKQQLEQIPWVESASVMRFVPNRLRIEIHERTPVAFARIGSHISLIDAGGNLMELAPGGKHKYSFPVIAGMNAGEALSTRAARMKNYNELMQQLDSSGARYSQEISEVDLTDTEDVKVLAADREGEVLVHLGSGNYLQRYRIYVTHVQAWRQQFTKLDSVDLRYDGQIIVNPDLEGIARQPALTQAAAKAALAAGVRNTAIVNYEKFVTHPAPPAPASKQGEAKSRGAAKSESTTGAKAESKTGVKPDSKAGLKTGVKASPNSVAHHARPNAKAKVKTVVSRNSAAPHATAQTASGKAPADRKTMPGKAMPAKTLPDSANTKPASSAPATSAPATALASTANKMPKPPVSSAAATGQKKPSPAIPKETPQN
jgi:cell division protein FtsQ